MKPQFGVSWRTYLKNMAEINDWISRKEYAKLYNMELYNVRDHFNKLHAWGLITRRGDKYSREYKISPKGIDKIEYLSKSS